MIRIRVSFTEQSLIKRKAKEVGKTQSSYIRELALNKEFKIIRYSEEQRSHYKTLVGIANNMNQVAKKYNQGNRVHGELMNTISVIQILINRLLNDVG